MSDDTDSERASRIFGNDMRGAELVAEALARALNPEVIFRKPEPKPPVQIIDLQRRYNITVRNVFRDHWEAIDLETFDPDPESRWHIIGRGYGVIGSTEAVSDLLEQLGAEVAKGDA